jgi:isopenicillin-N epimerase
MTARPIEDDDAWDDLRRQWAFPEGITYLNHGSFGPSPSPVRAAHRRWQDAVQSEPMDFFVRELEGRLAAARQKMAAFVGASAHDLVFVENATYGMNVVAASVPLATCDEILVSDHEYGAVLRIWTRACRRVGAHVVTAELPPPSQPAEAVVDSIRRAITPRTKLLVLSHITSTTALVLPVAEICRAARSMGVPVCIDGPHALATLELNLARLDCDYYLASGHKWLSAPLGSGFLYVHPRAQAAIVPPILSWGRLLPALPTRWDEEFTWLGTRDPSAYLSTTAAIEFLEGVGLNDYRARTNFLVDYARERIVALTGREPEVPRGQYVSMLCLPLPDGDAAGLQKDLRSRYGIEIPIIDRNGKRSIRVSCHLHTRRADVDRLAHALRRAL